MSARMAVIELTNSPLDQNYQITLQYSKLKDNIEKSSPYKIADKIDLTRYLPL